MGQEPRVAWDCEKHAAKFAKQAVTVADVYAAVFFGVGEDGEQARCPAGGGGGWVVLLLVSPVQPRTTLRVHQQA